jgi:hypothetical protein
MGINRRRTQTIADLLFGRPGRTKAVLPLRGIKYLLTYGLQHIPRVQKLTTAGDSVRLIKPLILVNCVAIGVFFAGQVGRQKCPRPSASVCG